MTKNIFCSVLLIVCPVLCWSADSTRHHVRTLLTGSINRVSDGQIYLMNNSAAYSYNQERVTLNARGGMVFGESLGRVTNRDYNFGSDFNIYWNDKKRWYAWGLVNALTSYSLRINHQFQGGLGVAVNIVETDNVFLNISNGILYEQSDIIASEGGVLNYSTFRNSLRVNFRYSYDQDRIQLRTTHFWQPSLQYSDDYIISSNTELHLKLYRWFHVTTTLQYNTVSRTGKENLLFTYGITLQHKF